MDEVEGPRWLDPEEREAYLALAAVMIHLNSALDGQLQRDAGLSHFEYFVLAALSEAPGRTRAMSELAAVAHGSLSRLSHVVARLEARGWVERRPCSTNGRVTLATLTEQGLEKVVATAPGHVDTVRRNVFDPLTRSQVRQLLTVCGRIRDALGVTSLPPPAS